MLWPPAVMSQLVIVIGQGDADALGGTRCLPPATSTADFTASGLAPVSMQNALKAENRGGSCTCASAPAVRIATVAIRIGPSLRICLTLRFVPHRKVYTYQKRAPLFMPAWVIHLRACRRSRPHETVVLPKAVRWSKRRAPLAKRGALRIAPPEGQARRENHRHGETPMAHLIASDLPFPPGSLPSGQRTAS